MIYGASTKEWDHWSFVLELQEDLLPCVCEPNLPLSPTSKLTSYGKVPSRFDAQGRVVGFPKWTTYHSSEEDLLRWSADDRLGICLQTRAIRALDVDVEEPVCAQQIRQTVEAYGDRLGTTFPCRVRANSAKCLYLFRLAGEHAKQVLQVEGGIVELLMNGQQCVVGGQHPSGLQYVWESTLPTKIPLLTIAQFEELKKLLREAHGSKNWTEGRVRKARATTDAAIPVDPVVEYLRHSDEWKGRVRFLSSERLDIMCPWIHEHTSQTDASSTSYFFAGTGGFECGHFRCLHAHCSDRSTADFLREIGYMADGFEDISGGVSEADVLYALTASVDGSASDTPHPLALPAFDRQPKTGKIKPHVNNLLVFMKWLCETGEGVRFDVFRDEIVLATPQGERPFTDADYTRLQVKAEQGETGFAPLQMDLLRRVVHMVAQNRCFDSAQAWIAALPAWDGVPRVDAFCSTYLGAAPSLYATAVARYLWSAMPGRILRPGTQADMSVILVSAQGTGKSSSIRAIAPMKDYYIDLSLSDRDADLSRLTRGKTLVELAELRGLHTKEMDSIKSFATRLESEWVPKYFEMRTVYLRRFIMMGTTNNDEFLGDATGERRWLPIRVGVQEIDAIKRDHAQLWAEGTHLYRTEGIVWREAQRLAEAEHADFSIQDTWVDDIDEWLHREEFGRRPVDGEFLLMKEVLRDGLRLEKTDKARANQMRAADALRRLGYAPQTKWLNNRPQRVWVKNLTTSYDLQNEVVMDFF